MNGIGLAGARRRTAATESGPAQGTHPVDEISGSAASARWSTHQFRGNPDEGVRSRGGSKLSSQLGAYSGNTRPPDVKDVDALKALRRGGGLFGKRLQPLRGAFEELNKFGLSRRHRPRLAHRRSRAPIDGLNHASAVQ